MSTGTIFTTEGCNALRAIKTKESYGCEKLFAEIETLYKEILDLSKEVLESAEADIDLKSRNAPVYDRDSTISKLDRAATELALTQGEVDARTRVFDATISQVEKASLDFIAWQRENEKNNEENDESPAQEVSAPEVPAPEVPEITELYEEILKETVPKPNKESRKTILKSSRELKRHKQTLLWQLMPEVDLGDSDKWWISLGSLVSKHVGGELERIVLDPEPNGYNLSEDDSDEELFVSRKTDLRCPLTRDYLENPVRAVKCNHLYSARAFQEYLESNRGQSPCPVAGCTNNLQGETDVQVDEDARVRVELLKKKAEKLKNKGILKTVSI